MADETKNQLNIEVKGKIATLKSQNFQLVGGNSDYEVVFDFDEAWNNYNVKTALFVFGKDTISKVLEGNVCEGVAINNATTCYIGVFSGDMVATTPAQVNCVYQSITDIGGVPQDPSPSVYNQIIELLNKYIGQGGNGNAVSPTVKIEEIENGHRITITDFSGQHIADVLNGEKGERGTDGNDGVSATHSWNGTVLTITSASGTSSANLKGEKGDKGDTGAVGAKGDKGDQGLQGIQGIKGDKGDKGDKGEQGLQGDSYKLTETDKQDISDLTVEKGISDGKLVPRMPLIDKEVENDPNYKFAYDFAGQYDRVYVEQSGGGWNGNGGNVYNKYVISSDGNPVYDPDFKDYKVDENGKPCGEKLNSIPMRLAHGFIRVPPYTKKQIAALGLSETERKQLTAPLVYVDETLELAKEYVDEGLSGVANSATKTQTGALLVLDDINPLSKSARASGEGGTVFYVGGSNLAHSDTVTSEKNIAWGAARMNVYIPKNRKYIFSCDFENVTGLLVGIAVKPDNRSSGWWKGTDTKEATGSLSLEIEVGDYDDYVTLVFYSNSSDEAVYSKCIFSNIVFALADMNVEKGTNGYVVESYTIDPETREVTVSLPDVDKVLIYNLEDKKLSVTYAIDTNKSLEEIDKTTAKSLSEIDKADWVEDAVPQEWLDTEISASDFPRVDGVESWRVFQKSKGSGYAYDLDQAYNRVYVDRSGGRGQYSKYVLTENPYPVPDPDYKDWEIERDKNGKIVSMTPKSFNDSIPIRIGKEGHIRTPKELSAYESLTGDTKLMAALSYGAATEKFATKDELSAIPKFDIKVVTSLPTSNISTTTLYLVNSYSYTNNLYQEYIYANGKWELLGTASVDLSDYVKSESLAKVATSGAYADLSGKPTIPTVTAMIASGNANAVTSDAVYNALLNKANADNALQWGGETNMSGKSFTTGVWYLRIWHNDTRFSVKLYESIGIVYFQLGNTSPVSVYMPSIDRELIIDGLSGDWRPVLPNTLDTDAGGGFTLYATKLK